MLRFAITEGAAAEADFIQLRAPGIGARDLAGRARHLISQGFAVLVNDRCDVALACGARGVHLRDGSVSPARIRDLAPPGFVISVACHSVEDVCTAASEGADYAVLAPIFAPLSKVSTRTPLGLDTLQRACRAPIRVIALGGITEQNAAECVQAGAAGIAGITVFRLV